MLEQALALLDSQYEAYHAMHHTGCLQRDRIDAQDLEGFKACASKMQRHIDTIRLLQSDLPVLTATDKGHSAFKMRRQRMRDLLLRLRQQNANNEKALKELMRQTRLDLARIGAGRRAERGYARSSARKDPRFYDGTR